MEDTWVWYNAKILAGSIMSFSKKSQEAIC